MTVQNIAEKTATDKKQREFVKDHLNPIINNIANAADRISIGAEYCTRLRDTNDGFPRDEALVSILEKISSDLYDTIEDVEKLPERILPDKKPNPFAGCKTMAHTAQNIKDQMLDLKRIAYELEGYANQCERLKRENITPNNNPPDHKGISAEILKIISRLDESWALIHALQACNIE